MPLPLRLHPPGLWSKLGIGALDTALDRVMLKFSPSLPSVEGVASAWLALFTIVISCALLAAIVVCDPFWVAELALN